MLTSIWIRGKVYANDSLHHVFVELFLLNGKLQLENCILGREMQECVGGWRCLYREYVRDQVVGDGRLGELLFPKVFPVEVQ